MILTVTTISGERVAAPFERWVQALILRLPPSELVELIHLVERTESPLVSLPPSGTIPADPNEWTLPNGRMRPQEPRRR